MAADDAAGLAQRLRRVFNKDVLSAVQLLHQETRCFVCCDYFCNPHQCQNGHTFCKQCLDHAMQVTATCPECRNPITRRDIKPNRKLDTITLEARSLLTSEYLDDFRLSASGESGTLRESAAAAAGTMRPAARRTQREIRIATTQLSDHSASLISRLASSGEVGGVRVAQIANLFSGTESGALCIPTHIVVGDAGLCPPPPGAGLAASRVRRAARAESASTAGTEASVAAVAATGPRLWARRRTPKYLMGLAAGAWVVSEAWVHACVEAGRLVDETPFELGGDAKAEGAPAHNRRRVRAQASASSSGPSLPPTAAAADAAAGRAASSAGRAGSPAPKPPGLFEGCVIVAPSLGDRAERHTYFIARAAGAEAVFTTESLADAVVTAAKRSLRLRILVPVPTGQLVDQARAAVTAAMALGVRDADAVRCHWVFESLSQAGRQPASQFSLLKESSAASFSRLEQWAPVAWSESRSCGWIHPSRTEAAMAELRAALSEVTSQSRADSSSRSSRRPGDQARAKAVVAVVTAALGRLQVALGPQHSGSERAVADGMAAPPAVPA
ncbi:hypothetical protein FNF27_02307 [Cafeteria roenbergensis]|uniref:RING-type E3 ubiquitin transferase BRCA1 n=1 Tax=Cafeteria roenbergensis TaxID=33653 RepID=A0A5A8EK02_CAFRO|nr:hypothetical protein FNF27_02307 [Cafeteria roenbergensis]